MKTNLPEQLTTAQEATDFLTELYKNGESYHPDDDAQMIALDEGRTFTSDEAKKLNQLMNQCHELLPDPCEILMELWEADVNNPKNKLKEKVELIWMYDYKDQPVNSGLVNKKLEKKQ